MWLVGVSIAGLEQVGRIFWNAGAVIDTVPRSLSPARCRCGDCAERTLTRVLNEPYRGLEPPGLEQRDICSGAASRSTPQTHSAEQRA